MTFTVFGGMLTLLNDGDNDIIDDFDDVAISAAEVVARHSA